MKTSAITVTTQICSDIEKVWKLWITPEDIMQWNNLSAEWHTTKVENDLRPGGRFLYVMGLRNGSFSFNFEGTYEDVTHYELITYTLDDQRRSRIAFSGSDPVMVSETFEPTESEPADVQAGFCKAVLESFKAYAEAK